MRSKQLAAVAPMKDNTFLLIRVNSFALGFVLQTDWQETDIYSIDSDSES